MNVVCDLQDEIGRYDSHPIPIPRPRRPVHRVLTLMVLLGAWGCASEPLRPVLLAPPRAGAPMAGPVRTIVIDAGHGGDDPGASHHGLKEKHLALDISKRLKSRLQEAGLMVVMTRETDTFVPLSRRAAIANQLGADLFVSVHINANRSRGVSGIEVYYPRLSQVSAQAPWPPSVSAAEIGTPSTVVKQVLWDLVLSYTRTESHRLATTICRSMDRGLQSGCRKTKPARFVVLREAAMPAVLVEVGYVSNQAEAQRLGSPTYRQAVAQSIEDGIIAYIRQLGAQHI